MDEEEITAKLSTRKGGHQGQPIYTIPDILEQESAIKVFREGPRLSLSDLEDSDIPSWLIIKSCLKISPFYLATEDAFPDQSDMESSAFCSRVFSKAIKDVLMPGDEEEEGMELDAVDFKISESLHPKKKLMLQLKSRKACYSNSNAPKYRLSMNRLVSHLFYRFCCEVSLFFRLRQPFQPSGRSSNQLSFLQFLMSTGLLECSMKSTKERKLQT